jgi:hypothetical protein
VPQRNPAGKAREVSRLAAAAPDGAAVADAPPRADAPIMASWRRVNRVGMGNFLRFCRPYFYSVIFEIFSWFGSAIHNFSTPSHPARFFPSWLRGAPPPNNAAQKRNNVTMLELRELCCVQTVTAWAAVTFLKCTKSKHSCGL